VIPPKWRNAPRHRQTSSPGLIVKRPNIEPREYPASHKQYTSHSHRRSLPRRQNRSQLLAGAASSKRIVAGFRSSSRRGDAPPLDRPQGQPNPFSRSSSWEHIGVAACRRNARPPTLQPTQRPRPASSAIGAQPPSARYGGRLWLHPNLPRSAAHHPNAFSRSIAATPPGVCIASLRGNSPREGSLH